MTAPWGTPPAVRDARPTDFTPGQRVSWWHQPRAGYSIGYAVDAVVVAVHKTRITIRVKRKNGVVIDRRVSPAHLTPREQLVAPEVAHG